MISIYGPPGIGKSALALNAARTLQDEDAFSVYRADMGMVCDVEEVMAELLRTAGWLGAAEAGNPVDEVVEWAASLDEPTLLVLDNCDDFLPKSSGALEITLESMANAVVCLTSPQTCSDVVRQTQRKQRFQSLLTGLLKAPGQLRVITTSSVAMGNLVRSAVVTNNFLVQPLDVMSSVSLLQDHVPNLNSSAAKNIAGYVGYFPQALVAVATSLQGGSNGSQNINTNMTLMLTKLKEGDVYGFLTMTGLGHTLGPPTLAYRQAYYYLTNDVKKCGRILAQSNTGFFTPKVAQYWLQSYTSSNEVMHCIRVLEERNVLSKMVLDSENTPCHLEVYQFRSLYKECFTFEQKKIWFPAFKELQDFRKFEEQLLGEYSHMASSDGRWIRTYYCT